MRHWILALLGLLLGIAIDGFSLGLSLAVLGGVVSLALGKSGGATGKDGSPPSQHASRSMTLWQLQQRLEALEIEVQLLREQARSQAGAAPAPEAAWQAEPPSPPPS
ncbi:hypothetical protein, partial [Chromobacterium phragmitis]